VKRNVLKTISTISSFWTFKF